MTGPERRRVSLRLVYGRDHYDTIIRAVRDAKVSVWISTANMKDVHVEARVGTRARAAGRFESLFDELGSMAKQGVEVRLLHAGTPSRALTARLKSSGKTAVEMRRCIRVHMKMIAVDGTQLYLGSANFTGAGLGAKSDGRRNFEAGIVTDDELLLDTLQGEFDAIWSGRQCKSCRLRAECPRPLDLPRLVPRRPAAKKIPTSTSDAPGNESASPVTSAAASPPRGAVRARPRRT